MTRPVASEERTTGSVSLVPVYASVFLTDMAAIIQIFAVDRDLAERGADLLTLGLVGGGMAAAFAVSSVVFGVLSDRIGRWPLAILGIITMMLATSGCLLLAPPSRLYFVAYWLTGVATGMYYPPIIAMLSTDGSKRGQLRGISRPLIIFCFAWNGGLITGTGVAGYLFALGKGWPIGVALAGSGVNLLILLGILLRPKRPMVAAPVVEVDPDAVRHQELSAFFSRMAWTANLSGTFSMSMIFHLLPRLMVDLGIPAGEHGGLIMSCRICVLVTYTLLYCSTFWHYRFYVPTATQLLAIAGLLIVVVAQTTWQLGIGLVGMGVLVGYNYFASLYYSTAGGTTKQQGLVSGIHEASLAFGFALGSVAGGVFAWQAERLSHALPSTLIQRSPYVLAAAVMAVLLVLQLWMYSRRRSEMRAKRLSLGDC